MWSTISINGHAGLALGPVHDFDGARDDAIKAAGRVPARQLSEHLARRLLTARSFSVAADEAS